MNVIIISYKFHPGHFSHLIANYKLFAERGITPFLYVNKLFNKMDEKNEFNKVNNANELATLEHIDAAVFWFPSLKNIVEIVRLRLIYKSKIIYIYHEPFDSIKRYYASGFRFKKILKICLIHLVNIPVLLFAHWIVLPSNASLGLYQKKYTGLNGQYARIPLLFDDEADAAPEVSAKRFVSYIGTVAADHAFDRFVAFVAAALENDWFPEMQYLIATSSTIPPREQAILETYLSSGKVTIAAGRPMTNAEINGYFRESILVWNAYNRSMQSGVLPKAYMFGAAVIVLSCNVSEFIEDRRTGVLIANNADLVEIRNAVAEIIRQQEKYAARCREKFMECFYFRNNSNDFMALLENKFISPSVA